jgi:hypothetical protein
MGQNSVFDPQTWDDILPVNNTDKSFADVMGENAPPPPEPEPPAKPTPAVDDSIGKGTEDMKRAKGRASNILTSRKGLSADATTAKRTLLGV